MSTNFDYKNLLKNAKNYSVNFKKSKPFKHIVIDKLFSDKVYKSIEKTFPSPLSNIWKKPSNIHTKQKMVTKRGKNDIKEMLYSNEARDVLREFNSGSFLHFLEKVTGINGLICDPYFAEAGFHCSKDGGYLDIHADFSHHDKLGLERRLNLIFFMNENWKEEYNGYLSLYNKKLDPFIKIKPIGNTCVLFKTSEISYHGHPEPMKLPKNVFRKSIALYYYTLPTKRKKSKIIFPEDKSFLNKISKE